MQLETRWQLKQAESNLRQAQKNLNAEDAHKLQAAIEIVKSVSQKQDGK